MKNNFKVFGFIILTALIGLSIAACDASTPPSLDGHWHNEHWREKFIFVVKEGTFEKLNDDGWGEKGTFTYTGMQFTTTITQIKDQKSNWAYQSWESHPDGAASGKSPTQTRSYILGRDVLIIGEWVYDKE